MNNFFGVIGCFDQLNRGKVDEKQAIFHKNQGNRVKDGLLQVLAKGCVI
jgi:hypothetical protein